MAGSEEKTEKPTPKKISKARKQGQVAKSVDLTSSLVLGAAALILIVYGTYTFQYMSRLAYELLQHQLRIADVMTVASFQNLFKNLVFHIVMILIPFLGGTLAVGILANILQIKILFTLHTLKPSLAKLNPINGFKKLFSQRSIVELIKGIIKMVIVGASAYVVINAYKGQLLSMSDMGFVAAWMLIVQIVINICLAVAIVLFVLGIADWIYQRHHLMKQLMMTKQELKDEIKNTEGNPQIKRKIRSTGQAIARQMLKAVPAADVVVTNPTHISVAIQYDPDEAPAPRVVAKGADHMAFRIREIAKEHGIPIVENRPLARTIYHMVEVNHMIPPELFIAVAEVLAYVFKKNKGCRKAHIRRMYESGVVR